jgi:hypothetical protein
MTRTRQHTSAGLRGSHDFYEGLAELPASTSATTPTSFRRAHREPADRAASLTIQRTAGTRTDAARDAGVSPLLAVDDLVGGVLFANDIPSIRMGRLATAGAPFDLGA